MPKLPGIPHWDVVRAFQKAGFRISREGKHITMTNGIAIVSIPRHDPVNAYTLGAIITGAGMTVDEFKKLL